MVLRYNSDDLEKTLECRLKELHGVLDGLSELGFGWQVVEYDVSTAGRSTVKRIGIRLVKDIRFDVS